MKLIRSKNYRSKLICGLVTVSMSISVVNASDDDNSEYSKKSYSDMQPTRSSAIVLSHDDRLLWSVNPDNDTVSVISTRTNQLISKTDVGDEPRSVALTADGRFAYVANAAENSVSVLRIKQRKSKSSKLKIVEKKKLITGSEPMGVVVSPDNKRVFVANSGQDTVTVIDNKKQKVIGSVDLRDSICNVGDKNRHFQPRGLAVTQDSNHLYVTRFLSYTRQGGVQASDHGKEGLVCRLDIDTRSDSISDYRVAAAITLAPVESGLSDRNGDPTFAFPNQLQSIVIRDGNIYLPNIAASPSGPQRFDTNTQAFVNMIQGSGANEVDAGAINLHQAGVDPEPGKLELYFANPWDIAFTTREGAGAAYVVSAGSDLLVKLDVKNDGTLAFTVDQDTTRYIDLNDPDNPSTSGANAGKNPLAIAISRDGDTAYVMNYLSRNISVVDLENDQVSAVIMSEELPEPGSHEEVLQVGAEMFFSSRGNFVRPEGARGSSRNRLSEKGRQNCASCHSGGLTDGIIWQFASGPRKTLPVNGTFNPKNVHEQRIINASAVFDEVEDADFNTRLVSSAGRLLEPRECRESPPVTGALESTNDPDHGLILGQDGDFEFAPCVMNQFAKPNGGRFQPQVQLPGSPIKVNAHDALIDWQRYAIRTPNRPLTQTELGDNAGSSGADEAEIEQGRNLYVAANCQSCHLGGAWTKSKKDFVSPPAADEIASEAGAANANQLQFLPRFLNDIGSYNLNVVGGDNIIEGYPAIGGVEKDTNGLDALGFDHNGDGKGTGFNVPSILGAYHLPPYYHNGACETLACVVADVNHRTAGLSGDDDPLASGESQAMLVKYLESIDESTETH